jgi:hypothetical protein
LVGLPQTSTGYLSHALKKHKENDIVCNYGLWGFVLTIQLKISINIKYLKKYKKSILTKAKQFWFWKFKCHIVSLPNY